MVDSLFLLPFQIMIYSWSFQLSIFLWSFNRSLILFGYFLQALSDFLNTNVFGPSLENTALLSRGLLPSFLTIALFALALTYLLAPFAKIRVVDFQKALGWLLIGLVFFQVGPALFTGSEQIRRSLGQELYESVFSTATGGATIPQLNAVVPGPNEVPINPLVNQFGTQFPSDTYVDGLDIAMSYILADADDVIAPTLSVPEDYQDTFFNDTTGPLFWLSMTSDERNEVIATTIQGNARLFFGQFIALFGVIDQLIHFILNVTVFLLFIQFALVINLAFFERTEQMARALLDMWVQTFIFSTIIGVFQALVIGGVILGTQSLNASLTLASAIFGEMLMFVLLISAFSLPWKAMTGMFEAMSSVVGVRVMSPAEVGVAATQAAAGAAVAVATGGASAAIAAGAGATALQTAGAALAGSDQLYQGAALASMMAPEGSRIRDVGGQLFEGATATRMMGPLGGILLKEPDKMPDANSSGAYGSDSSSNQQYFNNETEVKSAVMDAMQTAVDRAPTGGYTDIADALRGVERALGESAHDEAMRDYLDINRNAIGGYVRSQTNPVESELQSASTGNDTNATSTNVYASAASDLPIATSTTTPLVDENRLGIHSSSNKGNNTSTVPTNPPADSTNVNITMMTDMAVNPKVAQQFDRAGINAQEVEHAIASARLNPEVRKPIGYAVEEVRKRHGLDPIDLDN